MDKAITTKILPATTEAIAEAAMVLKAGGLVAMPTETVYGLAADAFNGKAVEGIFKAKGRPQDNPLIVHISKVEQLLLVAREIPQEAHQLAAAFWPGPLTIVLPRVSCLPQQVCAGLDSVGVRLPAHSGARQLIDEAGVPLAAPSANLSGSPSPTTALHVYQDLKGRIPLVLDGGNCPVGVESTVLSLTSRPTILRPGFITKDELEAVLGQRVHLAASLDQPPEEGLVPESPGMKYRHYAPKADITLLSGEFTQFKSWVEAQGQGTGVYALCFEDEPALLPVPAVTYGSQQDSASQAAGLYAALRRLDELGAKIVYARSPGVDGVGLAVRNRLLRAAAFREIVL